VKLLFDENLPPSLVPCVARAFPGSAHVRSLHLERASDAEIWEFAKHGGYSIVTKDGDFHHLSFFYGAPAPRCLASRGQLQRCDNRENS
jgi:predicted nuclease of predicted toxin-antitoxin system